MKNKTHTTNKLLAQITKLRSLQTRISHTQVSGQEAVEILNSIILELDWIERRLQSESDE